MGRSALRLACSIFAARQSWRATTAGQMASVEVVYLLADSVDVVGAVIAMLLVRRVTALQLPLVSGDSGITSA